MDSFGSALLRLKQQVGVHHDKEIAALLGMTDKALHARKTRGAFPADKLFALASRRPDLKIDPNYVLHGNQEPQAREEKFAEWAAGIPDRLRQVRGKQRVAAFARSIGLGVDEVNDLEDGIRKPTPDLLDRYSRVSPEFGLMWLMSGERVQLDDPLTDDEIILIRNYRVASAEGQEALRRAAAFHREFASRPAVKKK